MIQKIKSYILHPNKWIVFLASRNILKINDEKYLKIIYKIIMGKQLNLENPITFNEKINWLKLYDRKEIYTIMVDKYLVKNWVASKIGEEYIIPTINVYNSWKEINFDDLPNQFVLKCNHDSGGNIVCQDKKNLDFQKAKKKIKKTLRRNFYYLAREWPYKNVDKKIIVEKYMSDDKQKKGLIDYKFMCFHGKAKYIFVCQNRESKFGVTIDILNTKWEKLPYRRKNHNSSKNIIKPKNYELMIQLAEKLAENVPFLRVDFYEINYKVYFGEMTFYPGGGLEKFEPEDFDKILGDSLEIGGIRK